MLKELIDEFCSYNKIAETLGVGFYKAKKLVAEHFVESCLILDFEKAVKEKLRVATSIRRTGQKMPNRKTTSLDETIKKYNLDIPEDYKLHIESVWYNQKIRPYKFNKFVKNQIQYYTEKDDYIIGFDFWVSFKDNKQYDVKYWQCVYGEDEGSVRFERYKKSISFGFNKTEEEKASAKKRISDSLKETFATWSKEELKQKSIWSKDFYESRNIPNAEEIISEIQSKNGVKGVASLKNTPWKRNTNIKFYEIKGFGESSKHELSKRQNTFSIEKCIQKYGAKEGARIWKERQDRWQETLNSKPLDEIAEINRKKSNKRTSVFDYKEVDGAFYLIKIDAEHIKIGITKNTIVDRYSEEILSRVEKYYFLNTSLYHAFLLEQCIKDRLQSYKINKNSAISVFGYTETFRYSDVDSIIDYVETTQINTLKDEFSNLEGYIDGLGLSERKNF